MRALRAYNWIAVVIMFPADYDDVSGDNECPANYVVAYVDGYDDQCVYLPEDRCNQMHVWDESYGLYDVSWRGTYCECIGNWEYNPTTDKFMCNW